MLINFFQLYTYAQTKKNIDSIWNSLGRPFIFWNVNSYKHYCNVHLMLSRQPRYRYGDEVLKIQITHPISQWDVTISFIDHLFLQRSRNWRLSHWLAFALLKLTSYEPDLRLNSSIMSIYKECVSTHKSYSYGQN